MDQAARKLISELGDALRETRRQHEALTLMFDAVVRACDELEKQAERGTLRSVGGYESSRPASDLRQPPSGPAPGARSVS